MSGDLARIFADMRAFALANPLAAARSFQLPEIFRRLIAIDGRIVAVAITAHPEQDGAGPFWTVSASLRIDIGPGSLPKLTETWTRADNDFMVQVLEAALAGAGKAEATLHRRSQSVALTCDLTPAEIRQLGPTAPSAAIN